MAYLVAICFSRGALCFTIDQCQRDTTSHHVIAKDVSMWEMAKGRLKWARARGSFSVLGKGEFDGPQQPRIEQIGSDPRSTMPKGHAGINANHTESRTPQAFWQLGTSKARPPKSCFVFLNIGGFSSDGLPTFEGNPCKFAGFPSLQAHIWVCA